MDLPDFLDPTTLCVALLVLALCLLWAYVMLFAGKPQQPNFSVLYEQDSGGPKPNKKQPKGKNKKQVSMWQWLRLLLDVSSVVIKSFCL